MREVTRQKRQRFIDGLLPAQSFPLRLNQPTPRTGDNAINSGRFLQENSKLRRNTDALTSCQYDSALGMERTSLGTYNTCKACGRMTWISDENYSECNNDGPSNVDITGTRSTSPPTNLQLGLGSGVDTATGAEASSSFQGVGTFSTSSAMPRDLGEADQRRDRHREVNSDFMAIHREFQVSPASLIPFEAPQISSFTQFMTTSSAASLARSCNSSVCGTCGGFRLLADLDLLEGLLVHEQVARFGAGTIDPFSSLPGETKPRVQRLVHHCESI
jgi:hypothetical protein